MEYPQIAQSCNVVVYAQIYSNYSLSELSCSVSVVGTVPPLKMLEKPKLH